MKAWSLLGLAEGIAKQLPAQTSPPSAISIPATKDEDGRAAAAAIGSEACLTSAPKTVRVFQRQDHSLRHAQRGSPRYSGNRGDEPGWVGPGNHPGPGQGRGDERQAENHPMGSRLAFNISRGRGAAERQEVWMVTADGQRRKIADDGYVVAWSPDGTRLVTFRMNGREIENLHPRRRDRQREPATFPEDRFGVGLVTRWAGPGGDGRQRRARFLNIRRKAHTRSARFTSRSRTGQVESW